MILVCNLPKDDDPSLQPVPHEFSELMIILALRFGGVLYFCYLLLTYPCHLVMENLSAKPPVPITDLIYYEISSSWWARGLSNPLLQQWAGRYYAWKVKRRYQRYCQSLMTGVPSRAMRTPDTQYMKTQHN